LSKKKPDHYEPNPKIKYPDEFEQLQGSDKRQACFMFERFLIARRLSMGPDPNRSYVWGQAAFERSIELMDFLKQRVTNQPNLYEQPL
jgi:hypothetical protein